VRGDSGVAVRTREGRGDHLPAGAVDQLDRLAVLAGHPAVAPADERDDDGIEVAPLRGELVLPARGPLLVADLREDVHADQLRQTIGEAMAGDPDAALEVLEGPDALEAVAEHVPRPTVADH